MIPRVDERARPEPVANAGDEPRGGAAAGAGSRGLRIAVVSAVGHGQTVLSSFDSALLRCGAHDYNLIPLSSVIPPGSDVVEAKRYEAAAGECGHRLFVVKAAVGSGEPGLVLAAAIGWYQWGDGRGVFVEHTAAVRSRSCDAVAADLRAETLRSLRDLCAFREVAFAEERARLRLAVARVGRTPTTALVLAVYQAAGWDVAPGGRA